MFKNLSTGCLGVKADMAEGLKLAKEFGFAGLDLDLDAASSMAKEKGVQAVKDLWASRGVRPGGFGLAVEWRKDAATFHRTLADFIPKLPVAAELGCLRCATWVMPCSDSLDYRAHFRMCVERFRAIAGALKDHGMSLGLEFIGPRTLRAGKRHGFVYSMDGMRALCAATGADNLGLLLDAWHWHTCRSTADDLLQLAASDVVYVHVNDAPAGIAVEDQVDNVRCLPGETGVIPIAAFLKALETIGYDGPLTVEPFSDKVRKMKPGDAVRAASESLDKIMGQAGVR